jgi:hypothetical protein
LAAKKRKKGKRRRDMVSGASKETSAAEESRGAEALTVFWMLAALTTILAETVAAASALFMWGSREADRGNSLLGLLPGVMLFTALVTGAIGLTLTPLVLRLRGTAPPRGVVAFAIVIGASPWLVLAAALIRG